MHSLFLIIWLCCDWRRDSCNFSDNENEKPTIIIDVIPLTYSLCTNNYESVLGGERRMYIEVTTKFFSMLKEHGVKMIFVTDGPLMENRIGVWCERRAAEFAIKNRVLYDIDNNKYEKKCDTHLESSFYNSLLKIAREFGTIIVATDRDCDAIVAHQANEHNALAVISPDTDFLIYQGKWNQWIVDYIGVGEGGGIAITAHCFNRNKLINHLGLNREQMKIFATIAGNDYTSPFYFKKRGRTGVKIKNFADIAKFCENCKPEFDDSLYRRIADFIYGNTVNPNPPESINMIRTSIESYNIDFELQPQNGYLEMYIRENALIYSVLNERIFQYKMNYMEFQGGFVNRILCTLRRISGVLLYARKNESPTFKLLTKRSLEEEYELMEEQPVYPSNGTILRFIHTTNSNAKTKFFNFRKSDPFERIIFRK